MPLLESCLLGLKRKERKAEATPLGLAEEGVAAFPLRRSSTVPPTVPPPTRSGVKAARAGDGTPWPRVGERLSSGAAYGMGVARPEPCAV